MVGTKNFTVFFVVQQGSLSLRARFLALSLRRFVSDEINIRACFPSGEPELDVNTKGLLEALDVELVEFDPKINRKFDYPIGNKLDASCLNFDTKYAIFLDTDTIFLRPTIFSDKISSDGDIFASRMFSAQTFVGKNAIDYDKWAREYNQISYPASKVDQDAKSALVSFPLLNSGVVIFRTDSGFTEEWYKATEAVLSSELTSDIKYPFADQASLSLVVATEKWRWKPLPYAWNVPLSRKRRAILLHYFRFPGAMHRKESRQVIRKLHEYAESIGFNALGELTPKDISFFRQFDKDG